MWRERKKRGGGGGVASSFRIGHGSEHAKKRGVIYLGRLIDLPYAFRSLERFYPGEKARFYGFFLLQVGRFFLKAIFALLKSFVSSEYGTLLGSCSLESRFNGERPPAFREQKVMF